MNNEYKLIKDLKKEAALKQIIEERKSLLNLNFNKAANQLKDFSKISKTKKKIARLLTYINSK